MAIIFTSPKRRQKMIIQIVVLAMVLFVLAMVLIFFLPQMNNLSSSNPPDNMPSTQNISIDFDVIDSNQFKNLELFLDAQTEFDYIATDENGKRVVGSIMAVNKDDARSILEDVGLKISSLEEKNIGRTEPFSPYY